MSKKLEDILTEALNKAAKDRDCEACTASRAEEPRKEADIAVGAVMVEAIGNHVHVTLEVDRENGSFVIVPKDVNADVDSVDYVENDQGDKAIRFNTPEAFAEFCTFIGQVSVT